MKRLHDISPLPLVSLAVAFELALALVGWVVVWLAGVPLAPLVWPAGRLAESLLWGLAATLPLMPLLAAMLLCRWQPIARLRQLVRRFVRQLFGGGSLWQLALVSLAAGLGEEVLFRGALQPIAIRYTSPLAGIAIASLLFGTVHAASRSYFWLASLVGAYLGLVAHWRGEILSAIVVHALYDFVALVCIARGYFQHDRS